MKLSVDTILRFLLERKLEYQYVGSIETVICGFSSLRKLKSDTITWVRNIEEIDLYSLKEVENLLVVCNPIAIEKETEAINFLFCDNPKEIFFTILTQFFCLSKGQGIESSAVVETINIGENCIIGHGSYIGKEVNIGNDVTIGKNVVIENKVIIGDGTIIHSGTVIGKDGFGYFKNSKGVSMRVPHFGGVIIGSNVEIGANVCIDRGTLDDTEIGDYVKIDNLCHIAHNTIIGNRTKIIALSLVAGSTEIGEECYIAPGTLIKNQLKIGDKCIVGMGATVLKNIQERQVVIGSPAKEIREATEEDLKL